MQKKSLWPIAKKLVYEETYSIDQSSFMNSHHGNSSDKSNKSSDKSSTVNENLIQSKKFFFFVFLQIFKYIILV